MYDYNEEHIENLKKYIGDLECVVAELHIKILRLKNELRSSNSYHWIDKMKKELDHYRALFNKLETQKSHEGHGYSGSIVKYLENKAAQE